MIRQLMYRCSRITVGRPIQRPRSGSAAALGRFLLGCALAIGLYTWSMAEPITEAAAETLVIGGYAREGHPLDSPNGQALTGQALGGTMTMHYGDLSTSKPLGTDGGWSFSRNIYYDWIELDYQPPTGYEVSGWYWPAGMPVDLIGSRLRVYMRPAWSGYPQYLGIIAYAQPGSGIPTRTPTPTVAPNRLLLEVGLFDGTTTQKPVAACEMLCAIQGQGLTYTCTTNELGRCWLDLPRLAAWYDVMPVLPPGVEAEASSVPWPGVQTVGNTVRFWSPMNSSTGWVYWYLTEAVAPTVGAGSSPTQTPYPTATLYPTATTYPTQLPCPTRAPTWTPRPTYTAQPTLTPRPTYTEQVCV